MNAVVTYDIEGKDLAAVEADLEAAAQRRRLPVFATHDLRATLNGLGLAFGWDCRVYELAPAGALAEMLSRHPAVGCILPCRLCVSRREGQTRLSMVRPTALLGLFADPDLHALAQDVEREMTAVLDEASA